MEYEHVLIPYDRSHYARLAVQRAAEIHGVKKVTLLHVALPPEPSRNNQQNYPANSLLTAGERLQQEKHLLEQQGILTTILIEPVHTGSVTRTVLDIANTTDASLIVLGAHGTNKVREFLLGSVSHDVVRNARRHVLLIHAPDKASGHGHGKPATCPLLFSSVLCPLDLSRPSEETIHSLPQFPERSRMILLHVIRTAESLRHLDLLRRRATIRLTGMKEQLEQQGIRVETMVRTGDPVLVACTVAEREDVSLILLSRYGRYDYTRNIPIGATAEAIAMRSTRPVLIRHPVIAPDVVVRELHPEEFRHAEQVWTQYHDQKGDPKTDRIVAIFVEGTIAGVARCRRHPDGFEVDGVVVTRGFRDRGYARRLMQELVQQCGDETLYMHSTLELVSFYRTFGFEPIPKDQLPPTIRERFNFAPGNMQGSEVSPMKRVPPARQPSH